MSKKYIYWVWGNGGIMKKSLRETNKQAKIQENTAPLDKKIPIILAENIALVISLSERFISLESCINSR